MPSQDLENFRVANTIDPTPINTLPKRTLITLSHHLSDYSPMQDITKNVAEENKASSRKIIAKEQAGYRAVRCTTKQTFNRRVLLEREFIQGNYLPIFLWTPRQFLAGCGTNLLSDLEDVQHQCQPDQGHRHLRNTPTSQLQSSSFAP